VVSAVGAVASVLATPVAGALSDRTAHTRGIAHLRGRRHRWTLAMALLGAASLVIMAKQVTVVGVAIGWSAAMSCSRSPWWRWPCRSRC
jgi:MFS family permease